MGKTAQDSYPWKLATKYIKLQLSDLDKVGTDLECETHSLMATECEAGPFAKDNNTVRGVDTSAPTLNRVMRWLKRNS